MFLYKKIIQNLIKKNITISIAESCTGGLLSTKITSVSGVSKIFQMGLVTYSNKAKSKILKIPKNFIFKNGSVSFETAHSMVKNLKKISNSKLCISTTGISGPSGGTKEKPVGLVFIGINYKNKITIYKKKFKGSRKEIQQKTVNSIFLIIKKLI